MKRKLLSVILLLTLAILCLSGLTACAPLFGHEHDYVDGICTVCGNSYLPWYLSEDGTYCIIDCRWTETFEFSDIVIPDEIDGIPVKEINGNFHEHTEIRSVKIPNGVTTINDFAFEGCTNLVTVIFGNNVTTIGEAAFQKCEALSELNLPSTITHIEGCAFWGCKSLTTLTLPKNLTYIGSSAFASCTNLTNIVFPESLTSIDFYGFANCTSLTKINLPESLTFLGNGAFEGCDKLTYNEYNDGYYLGNEESPYIILAKTKCDDATTFAINESTKIICENVFNGFESLTDVTLPKGLTQIGEYAFEGCKKISELTIPKTLKKIGHCAFIDCEGLNSVYISDLNAWMQIDFFSFASNPLYLAHNLYLNRELITDLIIDGVETVSQNAFYNCKNLQTVIIGDSVTSIGKRAFEGCCNLYSTTVGKNVKEIGYLAFGNCGKLIEVINLSSITIEKSSQTDGGGIVTPDYPNGGIANNAHVKIISDKNQSGVVNLNGYLFYTSENKNYLVGYNGRETDLVLPDDYNGQNYEISVYAFAYNENIEKVVISDSVTKINGSAFLNCKNLKTITIGRNVSTIGQYALNSCPNLTQIDFNDTIEQWNGISKGYHWHDMGEVTVCCIDGKLSEGLW